MSTETNDVEQELERMQVELTLLRLALREGDDAYVATKLGVLRRSMDRIADRGGEAPEPDEQEPSHTPGTWYASGSRGIAVDTTKGKRHVGNVNWVWTKGELAANQALFVAAPDLRRELAALVSHADGLGLDVQSARVALAKADRVRK